MENTQEFFSIFITIAGFVIGLGAVTVVDLHGFLGRKSTYWTEATTRTHKVTKPLIWIGTGLVAFGLSLFYQTPSSASLLHTGLLSLLVLNGLFLSFSVSPYLLAREKRGEQKKLLPKSWQRKITLSFLFSFVGWWGSLALFVLQLVS